MKKLYSATLIIVVLTATIICSSCNKDFLDKNPLDQISSQTFWKTDADAQMALAGVYRGLQSGYLGYQRVWFDCLTDNAYSDYSYDNISQMTLGVISSASGGAINQVYNPCYSGIAKCNDFLANIDRVPNTAVTDAQKNVYKGEVRFMRAIMYFDLVDCFGDVILYKESPADADAAKIAKSPQADVLAFIHEDLDFAIANLPDAPYVGHAVKGSAEGFDARVLLYEQKWADAAAMAQQVITSAQFSLADNYEGIFLPETQDGNTEIMFSTEYLGPTDPTAFVESMDVKLGWYAAIQPYQDLVDAYDCIDGKPITESPLYDPADLTWVNRDPRLHMSIRNSADPEVAPTAIGLTGYVQTKYADFAHAPFSYAKTNSDQDMVWLRYADVLLMYAEAKNEMSGPDPSIYNALDQIRARPGVNMPPVDVARYNSQATLRDYIRHERRVEMALEGFRYFDIKRWGIADTKLPTIKNPAGVPLVFEKKAYLWPFQQSELDNNPLLTQTTGW